MCRELDRKNKCINQHKPPHWKSLSDAGFDTIDAAMSVPGGKDEAYLFRGTKYVRIDVANDKITYGPAKLVDEWPGLTQAGFDSVDAAIPRS